MTRERIDLHGQDEFPSSAAAREGISARAIDLEGDEEIQFLRTEKRVPVRRGPLAKKTANRVKLAFKISAATAVAACLVWGVCAYARNSDRFIINSSDNIEVSGVHNVSLAQVMDVARDDVLGRNIFHVSLDDRRAKLETLPWVESAAVMRLLPNHLAIAITERTPVAFVQIGSKINLIDAGGVVLGTPANRQTRYSFPVIHGITETQPLSSRAAVMKIYNRLISELDTDGYTRQVSEVDLADPKDVKTTVSDYGGMVVLHLGDSDFRDRFKLYATHIAEWRRDNPRIQSVDLRWEGQIVVNPDTERSGDPVIRGSGDRMNAPPVEPAKTARSGGPGSSVNRDKQKSLQASANVRGPKKKIEHKANSQKPRAKGQGPKASSQRLAARSTN
jgi:cell division protein FtsQ